MWRVPSLSCPNYHAISTADTSELVRHDAVGLFLDRTQSVLAEFRVTGQDVCLAAKICSRLDGIPLAIELAAKRLCRAIERSAQRVAVESSERRQGGPVAV